MNCFVVKDKNEHYFVSGDVTTSFAVSPKLVNAYIFEDGEEAIAVAKTIDADVYPLTLQLGKKSLPFRKYEEIKDKCSLLCLECNVTCCPKCE